MTTPDTAAVRAWAREQGITVADRGRLPAELREAYAASQRPAKGKAAPVGRAQATAAKPAAKPAVKPAAKKAPVKKATTAATAGTGAKAGSTARTAAPATPRSRTKAATAGIAPVEAQDETPLPLDVPAPVEPPAPVGPETTEARFIRLEERIKALAARVDALEQPPSTEKARRFRRRSS